MIPFIPHLRRWLKSRPLPSFTLQWHLTQSCPYHCRHCYDRSDRAELDRTQAFRVLDDLQAFTTRRRLRPQVCLSGGDPLHHPTFWDIYRRAADLGMHLSLLANPIGAPIIAKLLAIRAPAYYQVSLDGERAHDDHIRGAGHFDHTMAFLAEARSQGLNTHVMLTLTRSNLDQVLPLAESLRGLTSRFTFTRLAQVGEGAALEAPSPAEYRAFMHRYLEARRENPVLGLKDNLFNLIFHQQEEALSSGCTGRGRACGAAADFVALLAEGEVHACRKFPSPIGHILHGSLESIMESAIAKKYRGGSEGCRGCPVRSSCGGCPAVTYGRGLRPLIDRDPDCFGQEAAAPAFSSTAASPARNENVTSVV